MDETELKQQLSELIKRIGAPSVCVALHSAGLSPRQAEMLSMGDHVGRFRRKTVTAVCAVLAKHKKALAS